MEAWEEFLEDDARRTRFNDRFRGMVYAPPPGAAAPEAVGDYMRGFGHAGATAGQVAKAVGRTRFWVSRVLDEMVDVGDARVEREMTRGPRGTRRKVYFALTGTPVTVDDLPEADSTNEDACGGGRKVEPRHCDW